MKHPRGFTLIEVIVVLVLLGIMAAGAGLLISRPIEAYNDQLRRQQLVDSAEMALRKIAADIRLALPNSIRIVDNGSTGWALEMVNTVDGARYRDEPGGTGFDSANEVLNFAAADDHFNLLGRFGDLALGEYDSLRVVIYNTSPADIYDDAANNNDPGIISDPGLTLSLISDEHHIELNDSTNGAHPHQFEFQSPGQRLFVVDGAISYLCDTVTGRLMRFDGYGIPATQISTVGGFPVSANSGRVTTQVSQCEIDYQAGTAQRGGLITLDISLQDAANEQVRLLHQVHVDNVP